jgi:ABC-type uncharacterized transport system ATPase subunit
MTSSVGVASTPPPAEGKRAAPNGAKKAPPQLAAEGIAKSFGSLVVLEDVSLTLPPGRFHALLG